MLANTRCSLRLGCQLCWDHRVVCAIAPPSLARGSVPSAAAGERALPRPRLLLRLARASARAGTISGEGRDRCSSTEGAVWAARRDTRSLRVGRGPAARKAQLPAAGCGVQRRGELWIGIIGGARRGRSMISTFSVPASIAPLDNRALASRPSPILLWSHRESRAASNAPASSLLVRPAGGRQKDERRPSPSAGPRGEDVAARTCGQATRRRGRRRDRGRTRRRAGSSLRGDQLRRGRGPGRDRPPSPDHPAGLSRARGRDQARSCMVLRRRSARMPVTCPQQFGNGPPRWAPGRPPRRTRNRPGSLTLPAAARGWRRLPLRPASAHASISMMHPG